MLSAEEIDDHEPRKTTLDVANIVDKPVYAAIHDYLKVAAGSHSQAARQPGLYLVNEDLQKIKRFCRHVNQLPANYPEVVAYLGYSETPVEGLSPGRIAAMHRSLQEIANVWTAVEDNMVKVGAALVAFSGDLSSFGNSIIELIRSMAGYKSHEGLAIDVTRDDLGTLPAVPLGLSDLRALPSLVALTDDLVSIVDKHKKDAQKVKLHIEYFRAELRSARDDIARKLALAVRYDGNEQVSTLNEEIARLNAQIDELSSTYRTYTNHIWVGAWWGPVGLGITASIYGFKAIRTKSEYEQLIDNKKGLENKLSTLNKLLKALLELETDLQNIQLLTEEALSGASNLENIWTVIGAYITASVDRIRTTNSATTLFIFEARLSHMLNQWGNVEKEAWILMQALTQEALEPSPA